MADFEKLFQAYSKFGNSKSDGKSITLTNSDKWMKEAKVIDGKTITTTDTAIEFKKFKSNTIDFKQYQQFVETLAKSKKFDPGNLIKQLTTVSASTAGATTAVETGAVDRLTDTSKYTGTHKERFDAEGKGKGLEGSADTSKNDGYVQGYKEKDTHERKKKPHGFTNIGMK